MFNYTVSKKKQDTNLLPTTSPNINRFSNFFSLRDSVVNLQPPHVWMFHYALNMSVHYLVKYDNNNNNRLTAFDPGQPG